MNKEELRQPFVSVGGRFAKAVFAAANEALSSRQPVTITVGGNTAAQESLNTQLPTSVPEKPTNGNSQEEMTGAKI